MIEVLMALTLFGAADQTAGESDEPRQWNSVRWEVFPIPQLPSRFEGTVQAEVSCVALQGRRVGDCQIVRIAPQEHDNLRREILRSLRRARYSDIGISPGDNLRFLMTACTPAEGVHVCPRIPWDDAQMQPSRSMESDE